MNPHRRLVRDLPVWILVACAAMSALAPAALAGVVGATSRAQFAQDGLALPSPWTLENVRSVLSDPRLLLIPAAWTAAAALVLCITQTFFSLLAAFAFARFTFRGRRALFAVLLVSWMMPPAVTMLPLYLAFSRLGLNGSFLALVVPFALSSPYAVFLLRQWFAELPDEFFDAAAIDGASAWRTLWEVAVPLSHPPLATVILVTAVTTWNSYLWPRLIAGVRLPQVQVAIASLQTQYDANWTLVLAASTLALLPPLLLTLAMQRPLLRTMRSRLTKEMS